MTSWLAASSALAPGAAACRRGAQPLILEKNPHKAEVNLPCGEDKLK